MKFNINDYKGKYAMHCKTEKEAKSFCNYLHEHGKSWTNGDSYVRRTEWNKYKKDTCYNFNGAAYCDLDYYKCEGYTILEWADFTNDEFYKGHLKTGDIIQCRDGKVGIINADLGMIIFKDGWDDLNNFHYDLTSTHEFHELDIMAVRRPKDKSDCGFRAFELNYGTLVYEREEVVEMTLAEVCKALGKNIKIIK